MKNEKFYVTVFTGICNKIHYFFFITEGHTVLRAPYLDLFVYGIDEIAQGREVVYVDPDETFPSEKEVRGEHVVSCRPFTDSEREALNEEVELIKKYGNDYVIFFNADRCHGCPTTNIYHMRSECVCDA